MIETLSVAVAGNLLPHEGLPPEQIAAFEKTTGIKKTRRWGSSTAELAMQAIRFDGRLQGINPFAVVFVTQSPDRNSPSMANYVARELSLPRGLLVFDVNQSCTGFIYGLFLAQTLATFYEGHVLLVCVDKLRAREGTLDNFIFSDASCAALISPGAQDRYEFNTDASGLEKLKGGPGGLLEMDGGAVFDFVTKNVPNILKKQPPRDVLIQHQANLSMMKMVDRRSGYEGKSIHTIEEFGNMSMVSIPAAIAKEEEKILGKSVLLCGYGAGWSVATVGMTWSEKPICKLNEVRTPQT